jgi:NAD(P)-dependent dehydrogenase (short-subunit alcohol dehydrogenase family)
MDLELTGKVALVSGGSRGIGKAIARPLAIEGADVVITARNEESLTAAANELARETGRRIVPLTADTSDNAAVAAMVASAASAFGRIDILVNCAAQPAGATAAPKLDGITEALFWEEINVKVLGYIRVAREVAPHMISQGGGRIINVSGLAARHTGSIIGTIRNVSVSALSKNLADDLGPKGINVTTVHPGTTRTERTPGLIASRAEKQGISEAEMEERMAAGNSINKIVDASEIAWVVAFLASPKSIAINGDTISVGGGAPGYVYY